jgi:hypothetical protein
MADTPLPFQFRSLPANLNIPVVVTSPFGQRKHPKLPGNPIQEHKAVDIRAAAGTPALAVFRGKIIRRGLLSENYDVGCGEGILIGLTTDYPNSEQIKYTTLYCHLQRGSTNKPELAPGTVVEAGAAVGIIGSTGASTAPHLHFVLREVSGNADKSTNTASWWTSWLPFVDTPIDPEPFIRAFERTPIEYLNTQITERKESVVGISPNIESLESFHPRIQYELTRRRISSETANTYMPFVKLTSLSKVLKNNLPAGTSTAHCPSLGIHGENEVSFDNIYNNKAITERFAQLARLTDVTLTQSNRSIIGYARTQDGLQTVPVIVEDASKDALNVPIPGITQVNVERSTAGPMGVRGGLTKIDLKIVAYSVGQVDTLLRYYLRPATRVVLELGRISSNPKEKPIKPFDWKKNETQIRNYFSELIKSPAKQEEFIKEYIYENYGNYEAFVSYVVKFNLKYNKNNTYEIDLTLHSVQQVEVPTKHTAVQSTCPNPTANCEAMDIQEYFSDAYSWKNNSFANLINYYKNNPVSSEDRYWSSQIIPIKNQDNNSNPNAGPSTQAGTRENEYFVSWDFFVTKILNDNRFGIASMLGNAELANLSLLRPTRDIQPSEEDIGLIANRVGYHPNLRSVNPEVMIIWNETAQNRFENTTDSKIFESILNLAKRDNPEDLNVVNQEIATALASRDVSNKIKLGSLNTFHNLLTTDTPQAGAGSLSHGVWINTKAIKQAFTSTDTISSAISMLLNMMNSATEGYWNLQLYSTDVKNPGMHIIDMGLSPEPKIIQNSPTGGIDKEEDETSNILSSIEGVNLRRYYGATEDKPKYIYMFNRGTKRFNDGELGSDLIDLNVEFNMPQVIAVQAIANIGGPAQKSTLQSINIKELREITLIDNLYTSCNDTDICPEESTCDSAEIQRLRRTIEIAKAAESAAIVNQGGRGILTAAVFGPGTTPTTAAPANRAARAAVDAARSAELELARIEVNQYNPNLVGTIREYADLGTAVRFIEINPSRMMKELNIDSTNAERKLLPAKAHAFNSSNLTKTVVDITLPGIGGINLFQSFLVDRVPSIIDRGFYVVTKITHEFSSQNGWITKIQGRFRFRPTNVSTGEYNLCKPKSTTSTSTPTTTSPVQTQTPQQALNTTVSNFRTTPVNTGFNTNATLADRLNATTPRTP